MAAVQFLTIIPVRISGVISDEDLSRSTVFFPAAGALQGLLAAGAVLLSARVFPVEISSGFALVALIISNGGFHLDGLADTFDALSVKSCGDTEEDRNKRLSVMKDSATGAIGAVAISVTLLLKFLFLKNLLNYSPAAAGAALLFLMPVFSKWGMVPSLYHGSAARKDGLGKMFQNHLDLRKLVLSSIVLVFIFIAADILVLHKVFGSGAIRLFCILFISSYFFNVLAVRFCRSRFGGITGDTIGAAGEISEIIYLAVILLWLQHFIW